MLAAEGKRVAKLVGEGRAAGARSITGRRQASAADRADGRPPARRGQGHRAGTDRRGRRLGARIGARSPQGGRPAAKARGRGARAKRAAGRRLDELADRAEKVADQIRKRLAGERITDRLVSLSDPDARPIRKGKLGKPTEFGYVVQLAEVTEHTRRGARGLILPASSQIGARNESELLGATITEIDRLKRRPRELAFDGGL